MARQKSVVLANVDLFGSAGQAPALACCASYGWSSRRCRSSSFGGRTYDRGSCPPTSTRHRWAETAPGDRTPRSPGLDLSASGVVAVERGARGREAGDGGRVAPRGLCALLEMALQASAAGWTTTRRPGDPGPGEKDGEGERMESDTDPRRVAETRVRCFRTHRVSVPTAQSPTAKEPAELVDVSPESPRTYRGHGLLRGADGELPRAIRVPSGIRGVKSYTGA